MIVLCVVDHLSVNFIGTGDSAGPFLLVDTTMETVFVIAVLLSSNPNDFKPLLRQYHIDQCVMEERESYFTQYWSLKYSMEVMAERIDLITPTTPPIESAFALPDYDSVLANRIWSMRYLRYLDWLEDFAVGDELIRIEEHRQSTQWRLAVWTQMTDCYSYSRVGRRISMDRLRLLVGDVAFRNQQWPEPVPENAGVWEVIGNDEQPE